MKSVATFFAFTLRSGGIIGAVLVATTRDAQAYVDPGTGAMILQIIGAVVAGALFYFRQLRNWIASWFSRPASKSDAGQEKN